MKSLKIPCALACCLLLPALLPAQRLAVTDPEFVSLIPMVTTPPVIDGEVDQIWHAQVPFLIEFVQSGRVEDAADLSARWFGLYDEQNFYFLIEITDQWLESQASADSWRNDWVEVYFNMDNVKPGGNASSGDNYQYGFSFANPGGPTVVPNGSREGIEFVPLVTGDGYRLEVRIPFATLTSLNAVPGFKFGFDIAINDNDGLSTYDSVTYWWCSTGAAEWSNINGTGTVGLGDLFDGNFAPVVAPVPTQYAFEGQPATITLAATDANPADSLTFSSADLPYFASITTHPDATATIAVNAAAGNAGTYTFSVSASDGARQGAAEVTLIIRDPSVVTTAPVFDPVGPIVVKQGNFRSIAILVTDTDSAEVSISATGLPAFATLVDNGDKTATLSLNLDYMVAVQDYPVTLTATDDYLNTDSLTFPVQVVEAAPLTDYYCDPVNGDMENDGSQQSPWGSLQDVFTVGKRFSAGDRIHLLDGYHGEPVIGGANADYVHILPAPGAEPRLSRLDLNTTARYWHISGLHVSRSYRTPYTARLMVGISGSNNILSACHIFSQADSSGWTGPEWISRAPDGVSVGGSYCVVEDCTILNINMGIYNSGPNNIIRRNHIQNFRGDGIRGLGNDSLYEYNYIADCYNVDDNHDDGFQSWAGSAGGSGTGAVERVTLRGNVIVETTSTTRPLRGSLQGIGCFDGMYKDWVLENNVVAVTASHGIALYGAVGCRFINNTVVESNGTDSGTWLGIFQHKRWSASDPDRDIYTSRDNLVRNNLVTRLSLTSGSAISDNNKLIGPADFASYFVGFPHDLRLKEGSPAIDAGTNLEASTTDADGKARPIDGDANGSALADWGAYEFGGEWRGLPVQANSSVDSGDLLGWMHIGSDPWVWLYSLGNWAYLHPGWTDLSGTSGGWIYLPR